MMQIVVRLLPSDQWSEFTFAPGATFVQLKIIVLRHWNILPGQLPLSVTSSKAQPNNNVLQTNSRTRSRPEWQAAETHIRRQTSHSSTSSREQALDGSRIEKRRVSLLSSSGTSSVGQTTYSQLQIESLHECARVIASYSFRSVCIGCFLPDEDVLARRCVDYDLLVIQPRSENISIDPRYASRPILRLRCSVSFPNLGENLLDEHDDQPSLHPRQQRILAQSRPSTASKIPLSTLRTLSSDSTDVNTNRSFKHVRLQVSGEKLWLHRSAQDGSRESGEVCLKSYTLPAIVSAIVDSTRSPRTLKLGFLSGDLLLVRASSEKDWSHILRCLGPTVTSSDLEAGKAQIDWRTRMYDRAVKSNLGLLPRPAKDQATTLSLRSSVKCAETEDPPPAADVGAVKADANELADVSQGKAAILEAAAAMKQQKGPLMVSEPLDDADVAQYLDIPSLSEQSEDITTLSTRNSNPTLQTAPAEINLRSPRHRNRNSDSSSFETRSFSAGWSTAASSPLSESGHQAYAMSRGARLLARDDRRLGRRSEEGDFPRRFFIEVDTSSATMGQAI